MLEALRHWILAVVGTALVCGVVRALAPEGSGRRAVSVVCGFVMLAAVLGLRGGFPADALTDYAGTFTAQAEAYARRAREAGQTQTRFIIESECEAYILDKAAALGAGISGVSVTARWSGEGFWVPASCEIEGQIDPALAGIIASELGIPPERQTWSTYDG